MLGALRKWQSYSRSSTNMEIATRIAEGRMKAANEDTLKRYTLLMKDVFVALRTHAMENELERRVFQAWLARAQQMKLVGRKVRPGNFWRATPMPRAQGGCHLDFVFPLGSHQALTSSNSAKILRMTTKAIVTDNNLQDTQKWRAIKCLAKSYRGQHRYWYR